jgi:hypothetical protein
LLVYPSGKFNREAFRAALMPPQTVLSVCSIDADYKFLGRALATRPTRPPRLAGRVTCRMPGESLRIAWR